MYYPSSENKGADPLHVYREVDLRFFSHMQIVGFPMRRLIANMIFAMSMLALIQRFRHQNTKSRRIKQDCVDTASMVIVFVLIMPIEPCHEKTGFSPMQKQRTQISCAVTAELISAFAFATRIVQFLLHLYRKL